MNLSRRELLTTFLGAPLALAACKSEARIPDGEIVGQNVSLGHLLREGRSFTVSDGNWQSKKVVIVGAGIAGLSAAWKLRNSGIEDFLILEIESDAGGTSQSRSGQPTGYPWGAHYLPVPFAENVELNELLDEMGLLLESGEVKEEFRCREPEERIFYKGRWYEGLYLHAGESEDDRQQFAAFKRRVDYWINWRDSSGRRAFVLPVAECSKDAEVAWLDTISFAEWLRRNGLDSERLLWYCDYACRDDYGLKLHQTSAWAGLFYFCSRVRKSGDESQPFITFPEGNGRFVNHFLSHVGDRVLKSHAAVSIEPRRGGADVIAVASSGTLGVHCERVIFASPIFTAPYIIRGYAETGLYSPREFEHNAWFVANLFLSDRPRQRFARDFPLAWDNVLYDSPSLGYVNATHQKGIDYGPATLTYYYPMCHENDGRTKLFDYGWRELADVALSDLSRAHPDIGELTTRIDIMRWGHAMISPRPGFVFGSAREKAARPFGNVHFAHSDLSGIALFEEAFYQGVRAAREVAKTKETPGASGAS